MENQTNTPSAPVTPPSAGLPPTGKSKTPILIGAIAGAVVLIGIVLLIVFLNMGISQKDYRALAEETSTVTSDFNKSSREFTSVYRSVIAGGEISASSKESFQETFTNYKDGVTKLADMKAMKDDEVKKAYDAFLEKNGKFTSSVDELFAVSGVFAQIGKDCAEEKVSSLASLKPETFLAGYDKVVNVCVDSLKKLSDSKLPVLKEYSESMTALYSAQRALIVQLVDAGKAGDAAKVRSVQSKLGAQASEFTTVATAFGTKFQKEMKDADPTNELRAFTRVLSEKSR